MTILHHEPVPLNQNEPERHISTEHDVTGHRTSDDSGLEERRLMSLQHDDHGILLGEMALMWARLPEDQKAKINTEADDIFPQDNEDGKQSFRNAMALASYLALSGMIPRHHQDVAATAFGGDASSLPPVA